MAVHMLKTVEEDIPKYKTKEMRRVFQKQINNLHSVNIPEHILRYMYCTLTGDNSAKATSHQIDERICLANETELLIFAILTKVILETLSLSFFVS